MKGLKDLMNVDVLYGVGLILTFAGSAAWIGGWLIWLNPFAKFGALMIVVGAILSLINKFSK